MESLPLEKTISGAGEWRGVGPKSVTLQTLKFALAAGVVVYLILRGDIAWAPLEASLSQWRYTVPAFLFLMLLPLGQLWRWQSLLRASGLILPYRDVLSYLMVSKFFNMAFPGYVSGDIIRGVYVSRRAQEESPARGGEMENSQPMGPPTVVASIVFDRVAGLLPLFVWSLLGLVSSLHQEFAPRLVAYVGGLAGVGLAWATVLFLVAYRQPSPPRLLLRISGAIRLQEPFRSFYQGTHHYVRNLRLMRNILGVSFITQGLQIGSFVLFGMALGIETSVATYLILVPWGMMLTAVPIAPSGLGVGQVAYLALFGLVGASQGANLFTLYMASHVLINLTGALLYPFLQTGAAQRSASRTPQTEKQ